MSLFDKCKFISKENMDLYLHEPILVCTECSGWQLVLIPVCNDSEPSLQEVMNRFRNHYMEFHGSVE